MSDKVIVTDCDGVLLNWEKAFHEWMTHSGYDIKKEGPKLTYHFEDTFDITREKGRELVRGFNESAGIGFLEPLRDSVEGVKTLVDKGYVFDVVTSLGKYGPAVALREMNLECVFDKDVFPRNCLSWAR
jgi:FMN phosphatase YigB (HAD superfamily)